MARNGMAPLSTTIALAFTSGSSTTSQRPTPKKITTARIKPPIATMESTRRVRERGRETTMGLSGFAIWEPAHAIPRGRGGQSALLDRRLTMGFAHDRCPRRGSDPSALGGWLLPVGDRRGIGEWLGVQIHFFPLFIIVAKIEFVL